jgi:ATP-dependent Lon protease|tara:strand:- start:298 stop:447 length:150 start_codon:yes stop_codon:yes gene_type:complete
MAYYNPDFYLYEKIKELQKKVIRLNDELADANYLNQKLQKKLQQKELKK